MLSFPNAKINLGLNILAKREDGYHDLESCFYPIPWRDSLEIIESAEFGFHSYGLEIPGDWEHNLCVKAYQLLEVDFDLPPIEIHLLKAIPMGAGLGGGSADGSFVLKLLNDLFELQLSTAKLEEYALKLGSDCPFFIQNKPTLASGRGEIFHACNVNLSGLFLAMYNPDLHISTKEAFSGIHPTAPEVSISDIVQLPINEWKDLLVNDFETSIFPNHPEVEKIKEEMYQKGAIYSSMTGTGSTVYGIFETPPKNTPWKVLEL